MTEYLAQIRDKGEVTIPRELRRRYALTPKKQVRLIPRTEGILLQPRPEDALAELKGLAKDLWPNNHSSVKIVKDLRKRADFEAKEKL